MSVPDAVGIALEKYAADKQGVQQDLLGTSSAMTDEPSDEAPVEVAPRLVTQGNQELVIGDRQEPLAGACPDCGSQLEFAEGCVKCHVCGFSECG